MLGDMGRDPKQPVTGDDLLAFGISPELVGRFSAIVRVPPPDESTLLRVIRWADFNRTASRSQ
jgi:ATP-dependent protease Clp ATPase subunit